MDWETATKIAPIRLKEFTGILDRLDQLDPPNGNPLATVIDPLTTLPFRREKIMLEAEHPGGGFGRWMCCSRYLSRRRTAVILRAFLHKNTQVNLSIPTIWEGSETVSGFVSECRHVYRDLHEVIVFFSQEANLHYFLSLPNATKEEEEGIDPESLSGRVMIIAAHEASLRLLEYCLAPTKLMLTHAVTVGAAHDALKRAHFDIVLCDLDCSEFRHEEVIPSIRQSGYNGPIIPIISAEQVNNEELKRLVVPTIIQKPFDSEKLLLTLSALPCMKSSASSGPPLFSELQSKAGAEGLISWYLDFIRAELGALKAAMEHGDFAMARQKCQVFKETGIGYGFPSLSEAANDTIVALDASQSVEESRMYLIELEQICHRMKLKDGGHG